MVLSSVQSWGKIEQSGGGRGYDTVVILSSSSLSFGSPLAAGATQQITLAGGGGVGGRSNDARTRVAWPPLWAAMDRSTDTNTPTPSRLLCPLAVSLSGGDGKRRRRTSEHPDEMIPCCGGVVDPPLHAHGTTIKSSAGQSNRSNRFGGLDAV